MFLHCDKTASHYVRVALDKVFGMNNFQSEIVWNYKRWSNSKKGLLNTHQVIYFYSKTSDFKFNQIYTDYSPTTNIDQILQERERDKNGKSIYKKDEDGNIVLAKGKKGVPLSDVWDIPYLNPKAKERVGYPTQKPVSLLQQIIKLCTNEEDVVLDPFCGSGTTCVAAKLLNRVYMGIDLSTDAVELANNRLKELVVSESNLVKNGVESYVGKTDKELALLKSIGAIPVQRNVGIDGFLQQQINGKPIPIRIQKKYETLDDTIRALDNAKQTKHSDVKIIIQTNDNRGLFQLDTDAVVLPSNELVIKEKLKGIGFRVDNGGDVHKIGQI
ncbi:site-specific DNA-methyltransferase [Prolixibacter sp. SD074]|uniref:DNA-methyltransferase n=1 Tax=Prolixibacter sp. SD074 TaxID=2652391 RepID=UPI00210452D6